jgi:hypothetical protein
VLEHVQQRQARGEVFEHARRGVEIDAGTFAQSQQTGDVIDLRVHQHHGLDGGVAQSVARAQLRMGADLQADVGRRIEQHPRVAVRRNRDGALCPSLRAQFAQALTSAQTAVAVPLREAAAGARTKHEYLHGEFGGCGSGASGAMRRCRGRAFSDSRCTS